MGITVFPRPIDTAVNGGVVSIAPGGAGGDAFGRLRVAPPETIFDSKQIFDAQPLFWDDQQVSGAGTSSTHSTAYARTRMTVANVTAGKRVRQTFMRFNYQPGKSQLILLTGTITATGSGITAAMGYFDDDNGIFYQIEDGTISIVVRTSGTGSPVDTAVAQSSWNGDKLDGTGASGYTLDPTKAQIVWIDLEWLGVGRVRTGFVIDGQFIQCHEFLHTNVISNVYMSTPNLPLRYEIENDGTGAETSLDHICSTVISEGGSQALGYNHYASTNGTHVDCATENVIYAIIGVRLKSTHLAASIDILNIELAEHAGNKTFEWMLYLNPTVAGTFTYSSLDSDAAIDVARGATANTVTGGHALAGGQGTSTTKGGNLLSSIDNALRLGSSISGTPDEMVLCVRPNGGSSNIDIEGGVNFRQFS